MKITENGINKIVKESIDKVLNESDMYDYDANYEDLIRKEYHNLCDLESNRDTSSCVCIGRNVT